MSKAEATPEFVRHTPRVIRYQGECKRLLKKLDRAFQLDFYQRNIASIAVIAT